MFKVRAIDHIEVFVPDREEAADWYGRVLGFERMTRAASWSLHPQGPLMISSDDGATKIALFTGEPQGTHDVVGLRRLAFVVDGPGFQEFLDRLGDHNLTNRGNVVTATDWVDHSLAVSVYFDDPWGTPLEVTTYDVDTKPPR